MRFIALVLSLVAGVLAGPARASEPPGDARSAFDQRQRTLSGLWAFATLNYVYCDVIGLMDADLLRQYEAGTANGLPITDGLLLGGTILMEVPMSMVVLSPALSPRGSRVANVSAGLLMTTVQVASLTVGHPKPNYVASSAVEIGTTAFITAYAWRGLRAPRVVPVVSVDRDHPTVGVAAAF